MVKMVPLICPQCGAELEIEEDRDTCFCTYCGTKLLVEDPNKYTFNHNVNIRKSVRDETKIAEVEHKEREKESDNRTVVAMFAMTVILCIVMLFFIH